jgi:hypothetical protein
MTSIRKALFFGLLVWFLPFITGGLGVAVVHQRENPGPGGG